MRCSYLRRRGLRSLIWACTNVNFAFFADDDLWFDLLWVVIKGNEMIADIVRWNDDHDYLRLHCVRKVCEIFMQNSHFTHFADTAVCCKLFSVCCIIRAIWSIVPSLNNPLTQQSYQTNLTYLTSIIAFHVSSSRIAHITLLMHFFCRYHIWIFVEKEKKADKT